MKTVKTFGLLLFSLLIFLFGPEANAQIYFPQEPTREMKMAARQEAEHWENELSLTAKETSLMEQKFLEYAVRRQLILEQNLPLNEQLKQLTLLKIQETAGMRNILTKPQYDLYVALLQREAEQEDLPVQ